MRTRAAPQADGSYRITGQKIFISAPHDKQTMLFSATLKAETRVICKKVRGKAEARSE